MLVPKSRKRPSKARRGRCGPFPAQGRDRLNEPRFRLQTPLFCLKCRCGPLDPNKTTKMSSGLRLCGPETAKWIAGQTSTFDVKTNSVAPSIAKGGRCRREYAFTPGVQDTRTNTGRRGSTTRPASLVGFCDPVTHYRDQSSSVEEEGITSPKGPTRPSRRLSCP